MAKYHISKNGQPGICRAKSGNCPLGSEAEHFSNIQEASKHAEKVMGDRFNYMVSTRTTGGDNKAKSSLARNLTGAQVLQNTMRNAAEKLRKNNENNNRLGKIYHSASIQSAKIFKAVNKFEVNRIDSRHPEAKFEVYNDIVALNDKKKVQARELQEILQNKNIPFITRKKMEWDLKQASKQVEVMNMKISHLENSFPEVKHQRYAVASAKEEDLARRLNNVEKKMKALSIKPPEMDEDDWSRRMNNYQAIRQAYTQQYAKAKNMRLQLEKDDTQNVKEELYTSTENDRRELLQRQKEIESTNTSEMSDKEKKELQKEKEQLTFAIRQKERILTNIESSDPKIKSKSIGYANMNATNHESNVKYLDYRIEKMRNNPRARLSDFNRLVNKRNRELENARRFSEFARFNSPAK